MDLSTTKSHVEKNTFFLIILKHKLGTMEVVDIYRTQKKRKQKPIEALLKIILKEKFCFVNAFVLTIL
jgi:hypothetical protein